MREYMQRGLLACALLVAMVGSAFPQSPAASGESGRVLGVAFDGVQVSNLARSIAYYQVLGFTLAGSADPAWTSDEAVNRLGNTKGASSRTATLVMPSSVSGKPFTLYLREYKGVARKNRAELKARDPGSSHFCLTVPDADEMWGKLESAGMLRPLSWGGKLIRMAGQTRGGLAYIMDPDDMDIEITGQRAATPATATRAATPATPVGFTHIGISVLNSEKSKGFYETLLGAQFPNTPSPWVSGDTYDSVVGGHGYVLRFFNGTFPEAGTSAARMRLELVEYQTPDKKSVADYRFSDIGTHYFGLEVANLDALYARLKAAGIVTWSEGGIVALKDGTRAVVVRDPDVGLFVELFEKARK